MAKDFKFTFGEKRILVTLERQLRIAAAKHKRGFVKSFRRQGFEDRVFKRWRKRKRADRLRKSKGSRAILVQSGMLRNSIFQQRIGRFIHRIISQLPYSAAHNYGFQGAVSVPSHTRETKNGEVNVKAHTKNMNLPQRKFMGISQKLIDQTTKDITKELRKLI